ncbi:phosphonate metabolism protein/1,5-bisphosphokinase (PRPP-forming) PhnN [Fodinicurvata halophila]|uniref:Ribose 1,5-bisphosphate phosphokinase PhnN n=1 Tax=Fodinicurvata halophila TaxID=1419723 RepID=A0ABV8ULB1_9PROT
MADGLPGTGGTLVLVAGPSGAGKDSLIEAARRQLPADRFVFPQRVITRQDASGAEVSDYVTPEVFARLQDSDAFALHWQAHGNHYGILRSIEPELAQGRHVVVNVSRSVIDQARHQYSRLRVMLVTASRAVLRQRLAARGRELDADIDRRLERSLLEMPDAPDVVEIVNDGALQDAIDRFITELATLDALEDRHLAGS